MTSSAPHDQVSGAAVEQVNDLFDSAEFAQALESGDYKHFLGHIPIAIAISRVLRGDQRIFYANKAFETLIGYSSSEFAGRGWSILSDFRHENGGDLTLAQATSSGEEFLGTFQRQEPTLVIVDAYAGVIQNEDGGEDYRIAALIDVTGRERAEREEFARRLNDKDILLKEVQHRVKNNLQLITALIRLEARNQHNGDRVNLDRLAGRIESLHLLYRALAPEGFGGNIDLGHYVGQIASAVMNAHAIDGVQLKTRVDHAPLSINIAMPIGLIVNELITNAFKYAFIGRDHGVISIECLHDGDYYRIVVADDGMGFPEHVTWPVPGKMGALIVQTLRENTETDLSFESALGKGACVTITIRHNIPTRNKH
jgi:PAS domain S-box-containing protein